MNEAKDRVPQWAAWVMIAVLCAAIICWGVTTWLLVPDSPRQWDFGTLPDTPGQSPYSTSQPSRRVAPPNQIPALPEARPDAPSRP